MRPAGPRYERHQTVRASWGQPVAWAGLDKEAPTDEEAEMRLRVAVGRHLASNLPRSTTNSTRRARELRGARAVDRANGRSPRQPSPRSDRSATASQSLRRRQAALRGDVEVAGRGLAGPIPRDDVHGHLRHRAIPNVDTSARHGRVRRLWTAASASILYAVLGLILLDTRSGVLEPILFAVGVMLVIEAALRRRLLALLATAAIIFVAVSLVWAVVVHRGRQPARRAWECCSCSPRSTWPGRPPVNGCACDSRRLASPVTSSSDNGPWAGDNRIRGGTLTTAPRGRLGPLRRTPFFFTKDAPIPTAAMWAPSSLPA